MEDIKIVDIELSERKKKIPNEKVNKLLLESLIKVIGEYVQTNPQSSIEIIARTIQAAQITYQRASLKRVKLSVWRSSIESKIGRLKVLFNLVEQSRRFVKLTKEEIKTVRNFMSQEQLKLGNSLDLIEAASRINEKILIYQKKIASYEKRKAYSQENRSFELYRRTFYRNLTSENKVEHDVPLESIKEFWSQMWETPEGNQNHDFDDYLLEHIEPENSINFLSFEEFEQTIRFQPNWKAAGPDGIYNFFKKKLVPIHKPLHDRIRNICFGHNLIHP